MTHTFSMLIPLDAKPRTINPEQETKLNQALKGRRHLCVSPASKSTGEILDVPAEELNPLLPTSSGQDSNWASWRCGPIQKFKRQRAQVCGFPCKSSLQTPGLSSVAAE